MRAAIREWIVAHHQPWRADPSQSLYQGRIGAPGALPLGRATRAYYERHGTPVEGRFFEDLMESELFLVLEKIAGWLPADERRRLDEAAAFGLASTHEPNACARRCGDGHAILIDFSFVSMLSSALELYYSAFLGGGPINKSNFALALNTTVASEFFHVVPTADPLAFKPGGDFAYRQQTDSALWSLLVFIAAHEAAHILRGHLAHAPERNAVFRVQAGRREAAVVQPAHQQEFDADRFAIELILRGADQGGLFNTRDPERVEAAWQANYGVLGWMFNVLEVLEILSGRIEMPIPDTHPPAGERWSRVDAVLQQRGLIRPEMRRVVEALRKQALEAATSGPLPAVQKEFLKRLDRKQALPGDLIKEALAAQKASSEEWHPQAALTAWFAAPTVDAAKKILLENPALLDPRMDDFIYAQALEQPDENAAAQMVMQRLPILQRCRQAGVDTAFEEAAAGRLPPPSLPDRTFSLPADAWKQCESALDARDRERCEELGAQSPELAAVMRLHDTIARLVSAPTQSLAQWILHTHPELMHPIAERFFEGTAAVQVSDVARERVELFRGLAARCREVGLFWAVAEMKQRSA